MAATSRSVLIFLALISFASSQSRRDRVSFMCWVPLSRHITVSEMVHGGGGGFPSLPPLHTQHLAKWAGSRLQWRSAPRHDANASL